MKKEKTKNVTLEPIAEADRVPFKEKLAYGIGGLMDGGGVSMMSCVMLAYMTKNGIAMTLASTIMMIAKFWDAITDPFMGFISDNTRGKWGRRKPYMFWGGISLLLCIFLVFLPVREWGMSVGGFTAYIILMYLLWNTCSTVTQVPYCSMASDITPSFRERNNANTVKLVFTAIASGLGYVLPLVFIEALTNPDGTGFLFVPQLSSTQFWLCMSLVFGTLFGGGIMLAAMDPSWAPPILVPIVALIMGLGFGGAQMMPWIIFPDTVDVAEMATGQRPTGTYSGMMTLARKVGGGLGVGMVGWVIGALGYVSNDSNDPAAYVQQSDAVLLTVRLTLGISVAVFITIALIASFRYKITSAKLTRIRYFIEARKSGKALTDEESAEREALIAELYGKVDPADVVDPTVAVDDEGNLIETAPETDIVEGVEDAIEEIAVTDDEIAQNEVVDVENDDKTTVLPKED